MIYMYIYNNMCKSRRTPLVAPRIPCPQGKVFEGKSLMFQMMFSVDLEWDLDGGLTGNVIWRSQGAIPFSTAPESSAQGSQIRHIADGSNPLTIEWKRSSKCLKIHNYVYIYRYIYYNILGLPRCSRTSWVVWSSLEMRVGLCHDAGLCHTGVDLRAVRLRYLSTGTGELQYFYIIFIKTVLFFQKTLVLGNRVSTCVCHCGVFQVFWGALHVPKWGRSLPGIWNDLDMSWQCLLWSILSIESCWFRGQEAVPNYLWPIPIIPHLQGSGSFMIF